MASARPTPVYLEVAVRRTFACSVEWPGWCRSGRDEDAALRALADYTPRYAPVAERAGRRFPGSVGNDLEIIARVPGNATTGFGAPGVVPDLDAEALTAAAARRLSALVEAAWAALDDVAATAPQSLRKGPRGGGRDRDKMLRHVLGAEAAYARRIGLRHKEPQIGDGAAIAAMREEITRVLRAARGAQPAGGKDWPARYAARRIAWHVLDHAWEMQDRSDG